MVTLTTHWQLHMVIMAKRQLTLFSVLSAKKARHDDSSDDDEDRSSNEVGILERPDRITNNDIGISEEQDDETSESCSFQCCANEDKAFQPNDKPTLLSLNSKNRNFKVGWYKQFPWLSVCTYRKKVFCLYCRHASNHNWFSFMKTGEKVFTEKGFQNWKKAIEKFKAHESSHSHLEARLKWVAQARPTIGSQLSSEVNNLQQNRTAGFLKQLKAIQFLTRQGIALQGHTESEGNLKQLLITWSHENELVKTWIAENRYTCHQTVNELITIMGQDLLRTLLAKMREEKPAWFSVITDEATDVSNTEQLTLSIRWVNNSYEVFEDPVGLFRVPNTTAATLFTVIKDLLIRCNLPLELCRGQAYDGAANMQGKRTGVAARFLAENPSAIPVHCFAHSLNLCLQGIGRNIVCLRDAIETVREISKLIRFSPKRLHLFSSKLQEAGDSTVNLKPLCPTRWTARTAAIDAILKDYSWKSWKKCIKQLTTNME